MHGITDGMKGYTRHIYGRFATKFIPGNMFIGIVRRNHIGRAVRLSFSDQLMFLFTFPTFRGYVIIIYYRIFIIKY